MTSTRLHRTAATHGWGKETLILTDGPPGHRRDRTPYRSLRGWIALFVAWLGVIIVTSTPRSGDTDATEPFARERKAVGGRAGLAELADAHSLAIGSAVRVEALVDDEEYAEALRYQFNIVTPENAMKWEEIHPGPDHYDFAASDRAVDYAEANGMAVRGHTLTWHRQNPTWLEQVELTRDEAIEVLRDHIHTVVGRYRGRIDQWDVVNEPLDNDHDGLRDNLWTRSIGDDYLEFAFRFAHEADPTARLFLNDYDGDAAGLKTDRIIALAGRLKTEGVPIHGVGLQLHVHDEIDHGATTERLDAIADLGLEVAMTEVDHALPTSHDRSDLDVQADVFGGLLGTCLDHDSCNTFVMWGFTDRYSWISERFDGYGTGTIFDTEFRPKPAYHALVDALGDDRDDLPPRDQLSTTTPTR